MLLASSRYTPVILPNIPQHTRQPPNTKNDRAQNSPEVEMLRAVLRGCW